MGGQSPVNYRRRLTSVFGAAVLIGTLASCGVAGNLSSSPSVQKTGKASDGGWGLTVYYTPVEEFHGGEPVTVRGRPSLGSEAEEDLGTYPSGFVDAAQGEGGGRITSGPHAGNYLNWSWNIGFWLDTSTRDAGGDPLVPFETAAVDDIEPGTPLKLVACGVDGSGMPAKSEPCQQLRSADWVVRDKFTPGLGGERRVDLYLGEQDRPDFTTSKLWVAWSGAEVVIAPEG